MAGEIAAEFEPAAAEATTDAACPEAAAQAVADGGARAGDIVRPAPDFEAMIPAGEAGGASGSLSAAASAALLSIDGESTLKASASVALHAPDDALARADDAASLDAASLDALADDLLAWDPERPRDARADAAPAPETDGADADALETPDAPETPEPSDAPEAPTAAAVDDQPDDPAADPEAEEALDPDAALTHPDIERYEREFQERREAATTEDYIDRHKLGEFLHGARATLDKFNLKDVEHDLKIKARYLEAIETLDLARLPADAYIPGYVRSYIRYLADGLPPELTPKRAYEKFLSELVAKRAEQAERGADPQPSRTARTAVAPARAAPTPAAPRPKPRLPAPPLAAPVSADKLVADRVAKRTADTRTAKAPAKKAPAATVIAKPEDLGVARRGKLSPEIVKPLGVTQEEIRARARTAERAWKAAEAAARAPERQSLIARAAPIAGPALVGLLSIGLVYGGYNVLAEAQRVIPDAPDDAALTVVERRDTAAAAAGLRPSASAYQDGGVLTRAFEPPKTDRTDGPIGDIDPTTVGVYARPRVAAGAGGEEPVDPGDPRNKRVVAAPPASAAGPGSGDALDAPLGPAQAAGPGDGAAPTAPAVDPQLEPPAFALRAVEEIWVRVQARGADGRVTTVFRGMLQAGEMVELPTDKGALSIRTGNAGGTMLVVEGAAYGPLGRPGRVRTVGGISAEGAATTLVANPEVTQRVADEAADGAFRGPIAAPEPAVQPASAPSPTRAPATPTPAAAAPQPQPAEEPPQP